MTGRKLERAGRRGGARARATISVKEAVFPFVKFPEADPILGPEMKSTGEVMGTGRTFGEAYAKSQAASGVVLPRTGVCLISVRDRDKPGAVELATTADRARLRRCVATTARRAMLKAAGIECRARQQGARGAAAHRRHDQERRDRADRQHHRGQAGDAANRTRSAARRFTAASPTTPRSPRRSRPARRSIISTRSTSTACRTCTRGRRHMKRSPMTLRGAELLRRSSSA